MSKKCSKCLYDDNHPFGLSLYENSCSGCDTHQEKYTINWDEKHLELDKIINNAKEKSKVYDCIVPVIGDAEDYYVLKKVIELELRPLVILVNDYFKNDIGWYNFHNMITYFDVDSIVFNPDLRVYKDLVRTSLRKFDHVLLPFLSLHTSFPVHIAKDKKIPLIIWGQHQAIEQVGKFSHYDNVEMSKWSRTEHDLFGNDINKLIGNGAQVQERDLNYYRYPKIQNLERNGVQGVYLSNYMPWDPLKQNHSILECGYKVEKSNSTFDIYERVGSSIYYDFHDLLKYKRLGYRKIRDHLVREIRHGRLNREDAIVLEKKYNQAQVNVNRFFDWLEMSKSGKEWFIKHKLKGYEHLIGNSSIDISIPLKVENYLTESMKAERHFITFEKGIDL